ncbi:MAG TPA: trehalose-phosphatase [bacterium]|nr:trehalose-phosphatase [bacterium]
MKAAPYFYPGGEREAGPTVFQKTPRLISLDFDGVLAEIAPTPSMAYLQDRFRKVLTGILAQPETKVIILGGRSVQDLRDKVRLPGILYVGNHGLDFSPPAAGWGIPALSAWIREVQAARGRLEKLVRSWPQALLEVKGPDLSLHFRRLAPDRAAVLLPQALEAVRDLPVDHREGKCVLEIKPADSPGKGHALRRIADRFFMGKPPGICVHVGDDPSDEDAFSVLRSMRITALGFKVGPEPTQAHYRLRDLDQVHRFLGSFLRD